MRLASTRTTFLRNMRNHGTVKDPSGCLYKKKSNKSGGWFTIELTTLPFFAQHHFFFCMFVERIVPGLTG